MPDGVSWTQYGLEYKGKEYTSDTIRRYRRYRWPAVVVNVVGFVVLVYALFGYEMQYTWSVWIFDVPLSGTMHDAVSDGFDTMFLSNGVFEIVFWATLALAVLSLVLTPYWLQVVVFILDLVMGVAAMELSLSVVGVEVTMDGSAVCLVILLVSGVLMLIGMVLARRYMLSTWLNRMPTGESAWRSWFRS